MDTHKPLPVTSRPVATSRTPLGEPSACSESHTSEQAISLLRDIQTETLRFLNKLPAFVYVVHRTGYRILYANQIMRRRFPQLRPGMTCYSAIWGKDAPCPFCPLEEETAFHKTLLYNSPFGSTMHLSCFHTCWNTKEPASLLLLSELTPTDKEQEQRVKRETIALALSMSYDTVIDIDPETGRYEFLSPIPLDSVPPVGDYETEIPKMCRLLTSPEYKELVIKTFSLANMLEVFRTDTPEVSLDFACLTEKGTIWKHRRAVPYVLTDGSRHIIGYSHDITLQKDAEQCRIQTEKAYRLALQTSYTEIYEVDPYANTIHCIQNNTDPPIIVPLSGAFREDILFLVSTC
ncbi:MAG: hypothetical protein RRY20_05925, partial [Bilophila sp.]